MANAWFALPPSLRPSASHRQGVDPIQHGSDQLLMRTPALGGDRTRRLPEPGEIGLACLEQFFREAAHLFKEGNRQAQSPIQEVAPHPLDQATQNLLNCRGLLCLSHLKKQAPPAIEVPGESQEWWAREGQVARGIHGYYPSAGDLSSRSPTLEATLSIWPLFIRSSVVMANGSSYSGSWRGEDSLGAPKGPPSQRK